MTKPLKVTVFAGGYAFRVTQNAPQSSFEVADCIESPEEPNYISVSEKLFQNALAMVSAEALGELRDFLKKEDA